MGALSCDYQKLLWKSKSHVGNLEHCLHHLQYSCYCGQMQWQPFKHISSNLFLTFGKVPRKPIASEFILTCSFIRNILRHECSSHFLEKMGVLSATKSHSNPRAHKPILKVLFMQRYIIVVTIYFSGKTFSQTI